MAGNSNMLLYLMPTIIIAKVMHPLINKQEKDCTCNAEQTENYFL
jgi:hypothetical protein